MKFKLLTESYQIKEIKTLDYSSDRSFSAIFIPEITLFIKMNWAKHEQLQRLILAKQLHNLDNSKEIISELSKVYHLDVLSKIAENQRSYFHFYQQLKWLTVSFLEDYAVMTCPSDDLIEDLIKLFIYLDRQMYIKRVEVDFYAKKHLVIDREDEEFPLTKDKLISKLKPYSS